MNNNTTTSLSYLGERGGHGFLGERGEHGGAIVTPPLRQVPQPSQVRQVCQVGYVITLRPERSTIPVAVRVRHLLKFALRVCGLRCIDIAQSPPEVPAESSNHGS